MPPHLFGAWLALSLRLTAAWFQFWIEVARPPRDLPLPLRPDNIIRPDFRRGRA